MWNSARVLSLINLVLDHGKFEITQINRRKQAENSENGNKHSGHETKSSDGITVARAYSSPGVATPPRSLLPQAVDELRN